jgi:hypothetical protein
MRFYFGGVVLFSLFAHMVNGCGSNYEVCEPKARTQCQDDVTYWVDSCDKLGDKIEDCECGCNGGSTGCNSSCCDPDCEGRKCGPDGCGDTCLPGCGEGEQCNDQGLCECAPSCSGRVCGPDRCGGTCPPGCSDIEACERGSGQCVEIACRDVQVFCNSNDMCCGWPEDGYPCPDGVSLGECYTAPLDIWCQPCEGKTLGDPCEVPGYGHGDPGVCMMYGGNPDLYCQIACRDELDCPNGWMCFGPFMQSCEQTMDCEATAVCDYIFRDYDEQGNLLELNGCHCQTDEDCPVEIDGFEGLCESMPSCDNTVNPPDCRMVNICSYARSCQCADCCSGP